MRFKNLPFLFGFLLVNVFSSVALSPYRHLPVNQTDTTPVKRPAVISEMDQNRLLLLDATVELDQALLAGVNASLDTLNVPLKTSTAKKDTVEKLREMKRIRERNEMKAYLDYMKDSLTKECTKLTKEKESIQTRLGINVAQKTEPVAANKPEVIKGTVAKVDTAQVASLPVKKPGQPVKPVASTDTSSIKPLDKNKNMPDVALKKEKKHSRRDKNVSAIPVDTIRINGNPATASNVPVKKSNIRADTTTVASLPVKKTEPPVNAPMDTMSIKPIDKNKNIPDVAVKKEKKHSKRDKNTGTLFADTVRNNTNTGVTAMKPLDKTSAVSTPDTGTTRPLQPIEKAVVLGDNRTTADANTGAVSPDTAMRIKSRYFVAYAQKALVENNYPKAVDYINSSIELWRDNYDAWFTKADMERHNGDLVKAAEDYRQCYRIDSTKPILFYNMALLDLQMQNSGLALRHLNKAIAMDPSYILAYMKRASMYTDTTKYNEAIMDYNHVLQINRNYYNAYKGRGIAKLMQRKFQEAIDDFTRYIIYDQSDAEVYYYRGVAKISNNEWLDGCLELSMSANMGYPAAVVAQKKNCE